MPKSNVVALAASRPAVPANPLCVANHPSDVVIAAQQVTQFMQHAIPESLSGEFPTLQSEGVRWTLMMVAEALDYANELIKSDDQQLSQAKGEPT